MKTVRSRLIVAAVAVALSGLTACAGLQPGTVPRRIIDAVTKGGPGRATNVLVFRIYTEGFVNVKMGYASAIAYTLFAIIMVITLIQFVLQKKWVNYD